MISMQVKEQGLLFSTPMMLALLNGTKSVTRRRVKPQPPPWARYLHEVMPGQYCWTDRALTSGGDFATWPEKAMSCSYGGPGDFLWPRETWRCEIKAGQVVIHYQADNATKAVDLTELAEQDLVQVRRWSNKGPNWQPSIHMPRWASRILLEITAVSLERLQAISDADAKAEGVKLTKYGCFQHNYPHGKCLTAVDGYRELWESLNGPGSWDLNEWVWVIEFRRVEE